MKIIGIIGGGLGGLASACVLGARGYKVILFERNRWLGGKAAVLEKDGFRFDMGPTILTLPSVLERIFGEAGQNLSSGLDLIRLDPQWRSFFDDGSTLDLVADTATMASKLAAFSPGTTAAQGYQRFIELSKQLHRISDDYFFWRPVGGLKDMFDARASFSLNILRDVLAMRPGQSVARAVRGHIPDPRVAQMVDHFTQYVGSAPDASPAVLCSRSHADARRYLVSAWRHQCHPGRLNQAGGIARRRIQMRNQGGKDPHCARRGSRRAPGRGRDS